MNIIQREWNHMRVSYQFRYIQYLQDFEDKSYSEKLESKGHMLECCWVLHEVFGLSDKEIEEIEYNKGLTNADIDAEDIS